MKKLTLLLVLVLCLTANAQRYEAYTITINGVITSATDKFIKQSLDTAVAEGATAFVIKLNTPGGVLDSTRSIVQSLLESPIPTAVYVSPQGAQAGSAGTFITLAAEYAVMAEGSNIGAAHPVSISGDIEGDMRDKVTNDTVAFMKSIAEKRGRNVDEAMLTVSESKSFTASEALNAGLIDGVVNNDASLMLMLETSLELDGEIVMHIIEPSTLQGFTFALANPNILMLLFLMGALLIFMEFKMPGTFFFAGAGAICLLLFLVGANFIPVNVLGILLILAAIGLLVAELFVTSFGLLTVAGVAALVAGVILAFDTEQTQGVSVSIWLIVILVALIVAVISFIGRLILKDLRRKPATGLNSMIGRQGEVMQWHDGKGQIYVFGELWQAVANTPLEKGQIVTVIAVNGMVMTVSAESIS
ncbi:MAG: nodulation protein NfeD [Deferribacteraceae bacterium]|jgi:membrane-bound serine protease (ClpP class)|nr:nodulation protein NfeD [Deferribacteraceae bacterium]